MRGRLAQHLLAFPKFPESPGPASKKRGGVLVAHMILLVYDLLMKLHGDCLAYTMTAPARSAGDSAEDDRLASILTPISLGTSGDRASSPGP
jgi:hypothetical protein